ncbi:MAG: hypothetical protein LUQ71_10380 [Methanoregula sp.]|nr:hypothetical protein [Methanoregula sp.]
MISPDGKITCDQCGGDCPPRSPGRIRPGHQFCKRQCAIAYRHDHHIGKGVPQKRGWRPEWKEGAEA